MKLIENLNPLTMAQNINDIELRTRLLPENHLLWGIDLSCNFPLVCPEISDFLKARLKGFPQLSKEWFTPRFAQFCNPGAGNSLKRWFLRIASAFVTSLHHWNAIAWNELTLPNMVFIRFGDTRDSRLKNLLRVLKLFEFQRASVFGLCLCVCVCVCVSECDSVCVTLFVAECVC